MEYFELIKAINAKYGVWIQAASLLSWLAWKLPDLIDKWFKLLKKIGVKRLKNYGNESN